MAMAYCFKKRFHLFQSGKQKGLLGYLTNLWPVVLIRSSFSSISKKRSLLQQIHSCLGILLFESGKFWFPAQVYNRENGHVGFMLSCYDASLAMICEPTLSMPAQQFSGFVLVASPFQEFVILFIIITFFWLMMSRYPPHGRRAITTETGVTWDRLRAPLLILPHDLHISDCLTELQPGDHIEIQWRRNKEFPYGWWYGVVGHLETCDGNANFCRCHDSDTLVLEFNQYTRGSRWRRTTVSRKNHREEGNEADGFYGGIRKLRTNEEISVWKKLWPSEVLE
ncbi:UNVERIFIED_CONTAM: F-box protein [Sesamum radiatum]|uniref:F-box protein n=1 Tax=Sesamum radiatum TaxID=300843 RepID=A0AAW2UR23_SESRA